MGLHLLKHRGKLSDEAVVAQLHENLYWQQFCGVNWPIVTDEKGEIVPTVLVEASSLVKFRKRDEGLSGVREIESILAHQMKAEGVISPKTAIMDTTAQEKHMAYPLDTHLLHRGRAHLVKLIRPACSRQESRRFGSRRTPAASKFCAKEPRGVDLFEQAGPGSYGAH